MLNPKSLKKIYSGSVKNVYASDQDPDSRWFSFTDQYSVFDWGQMPDLITNKGNALAIIGTYIFQVLNTKAFWQQLPQSKHLTKFNAKYLHTRFNHPIFSGSNGLQTNGLSSHFLALAKGQPIDQGWQQIESLLVASASNKSSADCFKKISKTDHLLMQVKGAQVNWPEAKSILHENLYFYPPLNQQQQCRLIPLEVVFRFGMVEGSSLKNKLDANPTYATSLGLANIPKVNEWLPHPILEFFTKLEPKDRPLSWQEAAAIANLSANQFEQLVELSLDTALGLHALFAERHLDLWDGKLEFIFASSSNNDKTGQILLADSVGPDELRLLYKGVQLSKEMLRLYYRHTPWYKSLAAAQKLASQTGEENWQEICQTQFKQTPNPLPDDIKAIADQLYGVLANEIIEYPIFPSHPNLDTLAASVKNILNTHNKEPINA